MQQRQRRAHEFDRAPRWLETVLLVQKALRYPRRQTAPFNGMHTKFDTPARYRATRPPTPNWFEWKRLHHEKTNDQNAIHSSLRTHGSRCRNCCSPRSAAPARKLQRTKSTASLSQRGPARTSRAVRQRRRRPFDESSPTLVSKRLRCVQWQLRDNAERTRRVEHCHRRQTEVSALSARTSTVPPRWREPAGATQWPAASAQCAVRAYAGGGGQPGQGPTQ